MPKYLYMTTPKKDNFSIFKGIGIILMVVGHSGCPKYIFNYIYLFHMALFYWVSGYFFNESYLNDWLLFIKRKLKSLYVPFIKYSIIFLFLHNLFYKLNIYNGTLGFNGYTSHIYNFQDYINKLKLIFFHFSVPEQLLGACWFLKSLLFSISFFFISIYISKKISRKYYIHITTIIIIAYIYISYILKTKSYFLPLNIGREINLVSLLYLGFLTKKYKIEKYAKNIYVIIFCCIVLGILSSFFSISIVSNNLVNPFVFILSSILGCTMIFGISSYLENTKIKNTLKYIGNNTMIILIYHFLAFKLVSFIIIKSKNLDISYLSSFPIINIGKFYWIFYAITGILIPIMFKIIEDKYISLIISKTKLKFNKILSKFI